MSHQDVEDLLPDLVIGELPAELAVRVEEHLSGCSTCRKIWSEYLVIWLVDGRPSTDPGGGSLVQ